MNTIRITPDIRRAITAGVRRFCGASPSPEIGYRDNGTGLRSVANALNWAEDADLDELRKLTEVTTIDACPELPGCAPSTSTSTRRSTGSASSIATCMSSSRTAPSCSSPTARNSSTRAASN